MRRLISAPVDFQLGFAGAAQPDAAALAPPVLPARPPPPPAWRARWVQARVRRGSRYSYWASSTCSAPSLVPACWAKMSRIRAVRSRTRTWSLRSFSSSRRWRGESSSSNKTTSAAVSSTRLFTSSTLPGPINVFGWGCCMRWLISPTTRSPAVSANRASSASDSSTDSKS